MQYKITIQGMHCAGCAVSVEKSLGNIESSSEAHVNLLNGTAVLHSTESIALQSIKDAVKAVGYSATNIETISGATTETPNSQEIASVQHTPSSHTKAHTRLILRLVFAWAGFIALMLLMFTHQQLALPPFTAELLTLLISLTLSIGIGKEIFLSAWNSLKKGYSNMDTLTSLGVSMALLTGVLSLLRYNYPSITIQNFSALAGMILTLAITGQSIENLLKKKSIGAQQALLKLIPQFCTVITESGEEREVETKNVRLGDMVLVKPASHIPCDGVIVQGASTVDESLLTGENLPIDKGVGDKLIGGTLNFQGQVVLKLIHRPSEGILQEIIQAVERAQNTKPKIQIMVDK
ncbi:probable copper-transporting ATPase PacS, partial [Ylistrum balloti]|uniref:probable copper-transporting ATPase PacS n=1 Tax=Ylistrum balloti TaxID=509963 RepID=UPI002905A4E7